MGWNDIINDSKGGDKKETKYIPLKANPDGSAVTYQMRVLDAEPYSRWTHWVQSANGGKGTSMDCIGKGCPACAKIKVEGKSRQLSSRKQHALNVINRASGEVEVLDKGNSCFESLVGILEEVGDLRNYDIKIRVAGEGTDTVYTPIPMPAKPLTDAEKALVKYDFAELYPKLTPEQMTEMINGATWKDVLGNAAPDAVVGDDDKLDVDFTK